MDRAITIKNPRVTYVTTTPANIGTATAVKDDITVDMVINAAEEKAKADAAAKDGAVKHYDNQVERTATPGMTLVLIFEEAAKSINLAMKAIDQKDMSESHNQIVKAENIYIALAGFLDDGFEISKSLRSLYEFLSYRLIEANTKKDKEILREVLGFTVEFRDTWRQAEKNAHIQQNKKN
ncbi:hypothetical protein FACS1894219_05600 [Clostridia bacterium]|nr:hypothetical protein FACS1894219_05600 [Clostridia bacterium]